MRKAQHHLADCFQKLHMTHQNAWYYTYNCTNDWTALKKLIAEDDRKEITMKPETRPGLAKKVDNK